MKIEVGVQGLTLRLYDLATNSLYEVELTDLSSAVQIFFSDLLQRGQRGRKKKEKRRLFMGGLCLPQTKLGRNSFVGIWMRIVCLFRMNVQSEWKMMGLNL